MVRRERLQLFGATRRGRWLHELSLCYHWASETEKIAAGEPTFDSLWPELRGMIPALYDLPPIYVIKDSTLPTCNENDGLPATGACRGVRPMTVDHFTGPALTVRINLRAADKQILKAFKETLTNVRQRYPSPIKNPGKNALNSGLHEREFHRWIDAKIVEITELKYREAKEGRTVKNAALARWLFPNHNDANKAVCDALKVRRRAFNAIHVLFHEPPRKESGN